LTILRRRGPSSSVACRQRALREKGWPWLRNRWRWQLLRLDRRDEKSRFCQWYWMFWSLGCDPEISHQDYRAGCRETLFCSKHDACCSWLWQLPAVCNLSYRGHIVRVTFFFMYSCYLFQDHERINQVFSLTHNHINFYK
jgi:hypothetical protein